MEVRMQSSNVAPNSSIDEFSALGSGTRIGQTQTRHDKSPEIEELKNASIAEETEQFTDPADLAEMFDGEVEQDENKNIDEFTRYDPLKDKEKNRKRKRDNKRKYRRIGKKSRVNPIDSDEYDEEDVYSFLGFLDGLWQRLVDLVEQVADEFDNWNQWFKKEKKKPPAPDKSRVSYIRDEFLVNRSPHLWKSDPNKNWILTFGNNKINNVVSSILYKYQNETISKDA